MLYNYTRRETGEQSLVLVADDGTAETLTDSHPRFTQIRDYLTTTTHPDPDRVADLLHIATRAVHTLRTLSPRISYAHGQIYFDGDLIDTALSRHLIRMLRNDDTTYHGLVRFMENIATNPSGRSRKQLFTWLTDRDMTITPDGCFIGYKGVTATPTNLSVHSGTATVNGTTHIGQIPNPVGAVIEMPRTHVNDDKHDGCSTGLHVGTWDYASTFGSKTLIVSVNPRDVVSVPTDCAHQKLRTCRYTVIAAITNPLHHTTYHQETA